MERDVRPYEHHPERVAGGPWYEEDCDWARVAVVFPGAFKAQEVADAKRTLRNWEPEIYERFFHVKLTPEDSYILRRRLETNAA